MRSNIDALSSTSFDHVGVVVKDIDKTAKFLSSVLGMKPWRTFETVEYYKEELNANELGVGEPFKLRTSFARLGGVLVELLQPLGGKSVYSKFLETKGEGLHHIAITVSNWDELVSKLQKEGSKLIAGGFTDEGKRWAFLDTPGREIMVEPLEDFACGEMFKI